MMPSTRHSLRRKLILLLTTIASSSVLIACLGIFTYQFVHARAALYNEGATLANLIADNSAAALAFDDQRAANETLASLGHDSKVKEVCLYSKSGHLLGAFQAGGREDTPCTRAFTARSEYTLRHFHLQRSIALDGETVGTLYLELSLAEMHDLLLRLLEVAGLSLLCASLFALLVSTRTERWVSGPILHLTDVAVNISREGNYNVRAKTSSKDEVGLLIDQFNRMLDRIGERESELRSSYDLLEVKVEERTADLRSEIAERKLIEERLEGAKVAAEDASRAKSAFLATMSHELRTPLNAIIGYSEMLFEDAEAAGQTELTSDLRKILSSARHLLGLISGVLDFSKIEAGQMTFHLESIPIRSLMQDVLATAEILATAKKNRLHVYDAPDGDLYVDELRFRQCLLNLISNACKFTSEGTVSLRVSRVQRNGVDHIVWSVQDDGIGIAAKDRDKLFKSFSQVDSSATRQHGGTGLGLAITQQLCQAMNGWIEVESQVGEGTTFSIYMPEAGHGNRCEDRFASAISPVAASQLLIGA